MIHELTIDTENTTPEQLALFAELYIMCCANVIMAERGGTQVQPLEAMGLAALTIKDAYDSVNGHMQQKRREHTVIPEDLKPDDIGRWVEYRSKGGDKTERGRIRGWSDTHVWVVYNEQAKLRNWNEYTGASTDPADLLFVDGPK